MYLYHYFEKARGPFLTISDLPHEKALLVLNEIQTVNVNLVNPRKEWFLHKRHELERRVRELFIRKGGKPVREHPFYMTVGEVESMSTWYMDPAVIEIHIEEFDPATVSFTYGDMFPIFNPDLDDGMEYRNTVYTYDEIVRMIQRYGYPEKIEYNLREGINQVGAPMNRYLKYVEAHVWSDDVAAKYRGL